MSHGNIKNIATMRFGILTVVDLAPKPSTGQGMHWNCICDCGGKVVARSKDLRNGNTASCGCLKPRTGRKRSEPALDINRPWRKEDHVDNGWLVLIGENALVGAGATI